MHKVLSKSVKYTVHFVCITERIVLFSALFKQMLVLFTLRKAKLSTRERQRVKTTIINFHLKPRTHIANKRQPRPTNVGQNV